MKNAAKKWTPPYMLDVVPLCWKAHLHDHTFVLEHRNTDVWWRFVQQMYDGEDGALKVKLMFSFGSLHILRKSQSY